MENWRTEAARIVRETVQAEGLSVEEAAARFAVKPRRIRNIMKGS
ncbi:MAG TPA: hypothetical protein VFA32_03755 [Dehalococcoidia bacterium]|jgi:ribosome-binding protein aMBF1 (putative translation factor)|nr:hypothetical protein [Dehalococcoidia bacterium]